MDSLRTFKFDSIYVIEFLGLDDESTGEALYWNVIRSLAPAVDIRSEFFQVRSREQLLEALRSVSRLCETHGHMPILHIETHGGAQGIESGPNELVAWEDLKPILVHINELTRVSLLVTLAACHGLQLGKILSTTERAPLWALIGPDHQVFPSDVTRGFAAFYREFLTSLDLNAALSALRDADRSNPSTWKVQNAEVFLAYLFGEFLIQGNNPHRLRQHEDEAIAMMLRKGPISRVHVREMREKLRPVIGNFRADFDRMKTRFLMLDLFPENRTRFPLTYEQAVKLHADVKQFLASEAA